MTKRSDMRTKEELVISALQQRISEIVLQYETAIANLRADNTMLLDQIKQQPEKKYD
jgi:hypothetical protein